MPAYARACRILLNAGLLELFSFSSGKVRNLLSQRQQELRDRDRLFHGPLAEVISVAERGDAPVAEVASKFERTQFQFRNIRNDSPLLGSTEEIRLMKEPRRHLRDRRWVELGK